MSIKEKELENVTGGSYDQINEIVKLFRKYGFEKEAKRLEKCGAVYFEANLRNVLKAMGYTHSIEVYADSDDMNWNIYQGNRIQHYELLEILEDFLYRKANNIVER